MRRLLLREGAADVTAEPYEFDTPAAQALPAPLVGYSISRPERVAYLPVVMSTEKGRGHVSRLLDRLTAEHDVVVVPCVMSRRLAQMLERRGFHRELHYVAYLETYDPDVWVWRRPEAPGA